MSDASGAARPFTPEDEDRVARLVAGLAGEACVRWRQRPGWLALLDFGKLIPLEAGTGMRTRVPDRGEWVVVAWNAHLRLRLPAGEVLDSREGEEAVLARLPEVVGVRVARVAVEPADLSLQLEFENGIGVSLVPEAADEPDDDQWSVLLPDRRAVTVKPGRRWSLRDSPTAG